MKDHLSDDELTAVLLGTAGSPASDHAASCPRCGAELESLRALSAEMRAVDGLAGERPAAAWAAQRVAIAERLRRPVRGHAWRLALAGGAAVGLALALRFWPAPPQPASMPSTGDDRALLASINVALDRPAPESLAPALLLAGELERAIAGTSPVSSAEPSKEN